MQVKNTKKNKNILILGGLGSIGLEISKKFYDNDYNIEITDKKKITIQNKKKYYFLDKIKYYKINLIKNKIKIDLSNFDFIIYSIGLTTHIENTNNNKKTIGSNLISSLNFLSSKSLKKFKGKMIYFGSTHQYGNIIKISEGACFQPLDYQSISKCSSEYFFKKCSSDFKFNLLILRFPNIYGFKDNIQKNDQGLFLNLINQAKSQKKIHLFDSRRFRHFLHIDDLKDILYEIIDNKIFINELNIKGQKILIKKVAKIIANETKAKIIFHKMPVEYRKISINNQIISTKVFNKYFKMYKFKDIKKYIKKLL